MRSALLGEGAESGESEQAPLVENPEYSGQAREKRFSKDTIVKFAQQYVDGKLTPSYKSEFVPAKMLPRGRFAPSSGRIPVSACASSLPLVPLLLSVGVALIVEAWSGYHLWVHTFGV